MAFEPLSWAIGFALTTAAKGIGAEIFRVSLSGELRNVAARWNSSLPDQKHVVSDALFGEMLSDQELLTRPAMATLRKQLRAKMIPSGDDWEAALFEQWGMIRNKFGDDAQPFFRLPVDEARKYLQELAHELHLTCVNSEPLFKATVISQLDELIGRDTSATCDVLPRPIPQSADLRALHLAIEAETSSRIDLVLLDKKLRTLFIWGNIFGSEMSEVKWTLLSIACLAANTPLAQTIVVGVSSVTDLAHSDGCGPVGYLRIHFPVEGVKTIANDQAIPHEFWSALRVDTVTNDNTPFQSWVVVPWKTLEERER